MLARIVAVALIAGCATRAELRVSPIALAGAADTLRAGRAASLVTTDDQDVTVRPDQRVEVITADHRRIARTVADVVSDCQADPDHLCELRGVEAIVVGDRDVPSTAGHTLRRVAIITGAIAAGVALTYCADACKSPYDGLAIAGDVVLVGGVLVWAWLSSRD